MTLVKMVYKLTDVFPKTETYGLTSQIRRASVSISSNIAEGCGKISQKDFARFLQMSIGSSYEVETQILIAEMLNFTSKDTVKPVLDQVVKVQKMTNSLLKSVRNSK